jgi:hypothetical protein
MWSCAEAGGHAPRVLAPFADPEARAVTSRVRHLDQSPACRPAGAGNITGTAVGVDQAQHVQLPKPRVFRPKPLNRPGFDNDGSYFDRSVLPYMKERAGSTDPTRRFVLEGVVVVLCEGAH